MAVGPEISQQTSSIPGAATPDAGGQQQTASQGIDIISELMKQAHEADTASAQASKAASIPVAGGHIAPQAANIPGNPNFKRAEFDTTPVVGHHNAQMQGIVNLSKGVASLVGQVDQAKAQKQTQHLAVNMERLMTATSSIDQAKSVLAQDPNNAAAHDQLQKANAIADEILSDDKVRKQISKAYNISFTDPSKNNTPEHAALKQATDNYSQQFQKQIPTQMAQDPSKVAAAQTAAASATATHKAVDAIIPKLIDQQTRLGVADKNLSAAQARLDQKQEFDWKNARQKAHESMQRVLTGANEHLRLAAYNQDREDSRFYDKLDKDMADSGGDLSKVTTKTLQTRLSEIDKMIHDDPQVITNYTTVRDNAKAKPKEFDKNFLQQANDSIYYAQQAHQANQDTQKMLQEELNRRQLGIKPGSSADPTIRSQSGSSATRPTTSVPISQPEENTDDGDTPDPDKLDQDN
jgi:hypothetical protein